MYQVNHGCVHHEPLMWSIQEKDFIVKHKKNDEEDAYISVAPRIVSRVRRRESTDPVFFFCFFFVRKKIS